MIGPGWLRFGKCIKIWKHSGPVSLFDKEFCSKFLKSLFREFTIPWDLIIRYLNATLEQYQDLIFICLKYTGMMTLSNGYIFRVTGHLGGEFTTHRWIPRTKANDVEPWCFLWINGCVNNREAGDLRRHRAHYDVTVMLGWWCLRITVIG